MINETKLVALCTKRKQLLIKLKSTELYFTFPLQLTIKSRTITCGLVDSDVNCCTVNGPYVSLPLLGKYAATVCNSTEQKYAGMYITHVSKIVILCIAVAFQPIVIFISGFTGLLAYLHAVPVSIGNCALASDDDDDAEGIALLVRFHVICPKNGST